MIRRPPRSTRTDTLLPYTTLFRSPARCRAATAPRMSTTLTQVTLRRGGIDDLALVEPIMQAAFDPRYGEAWTRSQRSEEHTSELQSLMRISYAVFCLKKKKTNHQKR